jgi:hypothetical protein
MKRYFLVKIKYEKVVEMAIKKVSELRLIDALSFTEAEARIIEEMKPFISGEFEVSNITPQKVNEIFFNEDAEKWFKAKVNFICLDDKGIEKKTSVTMWTQSDAIKEARESIVENMKGTLADYEIESISETKVIEVLTYQS